MSAPLSALYAHVPFCQTICGYCDFYSETLDRQKVPLLVDALLQELARVAADRPLAFETIFLGGGTPTTLPAELLGRLCRAVAEHRAAGADCEFTVEANPATVTAATASTLVAAGVNRVSIGAQSFQPSELRILERLHQPPQVADTVEICRRIGIRKINLDLIFGVPGQTLAAWLANLDRALALEPDHLSCYGLTYEKGTPIYEQRAAGTVRPVDPELEAEMFLATIDRLAAAGFEQYEISNFARPGSRCRHNLMYWHNQPHVGIGPSAAGLVDGLRYRNIPDTAEYVRAVQAGRAPVIESERLTLDRRARETAMLELRLIDGIDRAEFSQRFRIDPLELFADAIASHSAAGRLVADARGIRLTRAGLLVADTVIADFL